MIALMGRISGFPDSLSSRKKGFQIGDEALVLPNSRLPRPTFGAVQPGVGFGVAEEFLGLRVPLELAVIPVGQVAEVTDRDGAAADFHVANRQLAAAYALEPVLLSRGEIGRAHV